MFRTYEKGVSKKTNWLYMHSTKSKDGHSRTEINELNYDAFFAFEEDHMEAFVDRTKLSQGSGILVEGFEDEDIKPLSAGRRKRDVNEVDERQCKAKCLWRRKRWTGPVLEENEKASFAATNNGKDWSSFIIDRATSTTRCERDCEEM